MEVERDFSSIQGQFETVNEGRRFEWFSEQAYGAARQSSGFQLGVERAVMMITGIFEPRAESSSFRSIPLMPGMWMSVMTQSHEVSPAAATNSSAEA